jgi:arylsulfatase A-like enzyme
VLLIVIDTLRADHLGILGYPRDTSPCIDALAREGALFRSAYAQCSWTSPSMVSLFTGRTVSERRLELPRDVTTLAERFRDQGFATAAFVGNVLLTPENGFDRGFGLWLEAPTFARDARLFDWIRSCAGRRSFTWVHIGDPHDPYIPPADYRSEPDGQALLSEEQERHYRAAAASLGLVQVDASKAEIEREIRNYDDELRWVDRQVRELVDAYAAAGLLETTLVALTSDHGEGLWKREDFQSLERRRAAAQGEPPTLLNSFKQTHGNQVYEELVRVPLVLHGAGIPRGLVLDFPVENVDLPPTLLELCGLPRDPALEGHSLTLLFAAGRARAWPREEAFSTTELVSALVTRDGWKLILPTEQGRALLELEPELYDLGADPHERVDLAPARPELVRRLSARIAERLAGGLKRGTRPLEAELEANAPALEALGYSR